MSDEYKTIKTISEGYYTEKRSKFLAFAHPVTDVDQIKEIIAEYRKKYYDARHVCYAYMLGAERLEFRANDDGEPSSTAGKPILGQINSNELTDILIVVVRYYGGVNLGTSGLIVAYKAAAADAEMRREMMVEDEFFSIIEKRDTTIMLKDRLLAEKNVELEQKNLSFRKSIQMLHQANLSVESIAESLNMSHEEVKALL